MHASDDAAVHANRLPPVVAQDADDHRFRALVEAGADAVLVVGRDGLVAYANPAAAALMGRPRAELIGHPFGVPIVPGETAEVDLRRPDGTVRVAEMRAVEVPWLAGPAYHASLRDISERKRAEEALADADRRKDDFLAMLAHELRNPLAPIRNSLYLLSIASNHPEAAARARTIIERQVGHMTRLVDDLLDVSRITRGKVVLQRERVDLVKIVRDAVGDRRPAFTEKRLGLDLDVPAGPLWVDADPVRVAQVFDNLLENARKFTDSGGRVAVTLVVIGDRAEARVRDTGVGIDLEVLPRVFDAFAQADRSLARSSGGLGLGLAIVRGLIELHGGSVRVASDGPGHGTEFVVALPLCATQPTPPDVAVPAGVPREQRRRVLVVDDNRDAADTAAQLLELTGHEVAVAYSGPDAVRTALAFRPEVVVCDIGLPGMDGYAVAAALRAEPATTRAKLIALTGYGRPEDAEQARAAGFDEHLTKPVELDTLLAKLRH